MNQPNDNNGHHQEPPTCPDCGGAMVIRTARRGPNAGGQFYGCTNFPNCRGTVDIGATDPNAQGEPPHTQPQHSSRPLGARDFPRRFALEDGNIHRQQLFIESVALPRPAVQHLAQDPLKPAFQHALSQWKLDLPIASTQFETTTPPPWVHMAEKILKRGRLVPIGEDLQHRLADMITLDRLDQVSGEEWRKTAQVVSLVDSCYPNDPRSFDSDEEQSFYNDLIDYEGEHLNRWLIQQVALGGLTGNNEDLLTDQRVDFLLAGGSAVQR